MVQSVGIELACPNCASLIEQVLTQSIDRNRMSWELEFSCPVCGATQAMLSLGDLPPAFRKLFIEAAGLYRMVFEDEVKVSAKMLQAIRKVLNSSIEESRGIARSLLAGTYEGTRTELELLARGLRAAGLEVQISKI